MPNKFYSLPKSVFEHYHAKIKDWVRAILPTKTSDLTNDSDFLDQLALAGIIAVTFSASSTYKVGDYVLYNHTLYRCKTAITTAGAWDASKWDAAKTQDIFKGSAPGLVPTPTAQDVANKNMLAADGTFVPHQDLSEYIKEVNLGDIVAEVFSTSKTYTVGKYVIHDKKLYRCTTAVQTAGDWSSSNWTQVKSTDTASKIQLNSGSVSVGEDGSIYLGSSNKVTISTPTLNIGTGALEGSLPTLVYKDIVKNVNSNVPEVLFGTNVSDHIQTASSIPNMSGMITFFAGYDPSMGPIIDYVNNNVSKLKVLMKNDVTYDSILSMFNASPYLPILNAGSQYYYPHYAAPGYGFSWFNFAFNGKDQKMSTIYYYFLSPDNTWSLSYLYIPSEGYDNTDITTIVSSQKVIAVLNTETIDIEV